MTSRTHAAVVVGLLGAVLAGCDDECSPEDFGGGSECGPEVGSYQTCRFADCLEGWCTERWYVDEQFCPSTAPTCRQLARGLVGCFGEGLGPCSAAGFVRCEDLVTEISCVDDGAGGLVLSRGTCAVGARCHDPRYEGSYAPSGCDPRD